MGRARPHRSQRSAPARISHTVHRHKLGFITFCVSRRRREMYCGHPRLCVCACLSAAACLRYCTDPDITWGSGRGCPLVVHYWADLHSVHGLRYCYGNITRTRNVSEYMLVLALCLVRVSRQVGLGLGLGLELGLVLVVTCVRCGIRCGN